GGDSVVAGVGEEVDALESQRVVADLFPAELEAAPLLAAELLEVIDRAVGKKDPPVRQVVEVIEGDDVLPALRAGDPARVPVERPAVVDVITGDDVAPVDVPGARAVARQQDTPAAAAHELVPRDTIARRRVLQTPAVAPR